MTIVTDKGKIFTLVKDLLIRKKMVLGGFDSLKQWFCTKMKENDFQVGLIHNMNHRNKPRLY